MLSPSVASQRHPAQGHRINIQFTGNAALIADSIIGVRNALNSTKANAAVLTGLAVSGLLVAIIVALCSIMVVVQVAIHCKETIQAPVEQQQT